MCLHYVFEHLFYIGVPLIRAWIWVYFKCFGGEVLVRAFSMQTMNLINLPAYLLYLTLQKKLDLLMIPSLFLIPFWQFILMSFGVKFGSIWEAFYYKVLYYFVIVD